MSKKPKSKKVVKRKTRALEYASRGLLLVPMYTIKDGHCSCSKGASCANPGKHPITAHGVTDATKSRKTIRQWWTENPQANIGIATGKKSKILVLDIDPRNGGSETLKTLEADLGSLPATVTSETGGGGMHLVFAYPQFRVRKDSAGKMLGAGLDILSDGSIMVVPPSKHKTGSRYKWADGKSFKEMKPALLPAKWLAKLSESSPADEPNVTKGTIVEGVRNTTLTSLGGSLRRSGLSPKAISAALVAENKARCSPPLDDAEVKGIIKSVNRYRAPPGGDRSDDAEKLLNVVLSQHFKDGKHLIFGADGQFWHYSGKLWARVQDRWIEGRILESIQGDLLRTSQQSASLMGQVRKLLEAKLAAKTDPPRLPRRPTVRHQLRQR
jgi:putative DNA primase/helicase